MVDPPFDLLAQEEVRELSSLPVVPLSVSMVVFTLVSVAFFTT